MVTQIFRNFFPETFEIFDRSFSRDVITFQNLKLRHKKRYIYICLQFCSSITCFVQKPGHFEFPDYVGAWHKATIEFVEQYILISWFWALLEVRAVGKVLNMWMLVFSILIISRLGIESKFHMFTLFSGCHIGVPEVHQHGVFILEAL